MSIIKNSVIYSTSAILLKGVGFLLLPFYLRKFSTEEYGILDLGVSLSWLLGVLFSMGIPQVIFVSYIHLNRKEKSKLLMNFTKFYILISLILAVAYFTVLTTYNTLNLFSTEILICIFLLAFFTFFQQVYFNILKIGNKAFKLSLIQTTLGLLMILINLIFVFIYNFGIIILFISQIFTLLISFFLFTIYLKKELKKQDVFNLKLDFYNEIKAYIPESLTLLSTQVSFFLQNQVDKWMVLLFLSISSVGIYSVATKISGLFTLVVINSVIAAYTPNLLKRYKYENVKKIDLYNRKNSYLVIILGFIITVFCWFFLRNIFISFVSNQYKTAFDAAIVLLFGQFLLLALQMRSVLLLYKKEFKVQTLAVVISLFLNVLLNIVLVPKYSINGASIATTTAYLLGFIFIEYSCLKSLKKNI